MARRECSFMEAGFFFLSGLSVPYLGTHSILNVPVLALPSLGAAWQLHRAGLVFYNLLHNPQLGDG